MINIKNFIYRFGKSPEEVHKDAEVEARKILHYLDIECNGMIDEFDEKNN